MCLSIVKRKFAGKSKTVRTGYKVFAGGLDAPKFPYYSLASSEFVQLNKWLEAECDSPNDYTTGFHIFRTAKDAQRYRSCFNVFKVKYKGVFATGTQEGLPCVVTKFMYVPKPRAKRSK
jgi:hypothetical protein